uniref:RGS domain-containing protein n=1 Tax=Strongyloides papillosus TaxID=174720 RepID=A0A0N5B2V6_STREA
MRVKNEELKIRLQEINDNVDYKGLLVFLTYEATNGIINEFILQEIHKLYNFSEYMDHFYKEMYIFRRALNVDLFNSEDFILSKGKSNFPLLSFKKTYVYDDISQSLSLASISSGSCDSTPRSRPEKTLKFFLRKCRKYQICSNELKKWLPETTLFGRYNNYQDSNQLKTSDVISAIELGILSSKNNKVEIEIIKNFLGTTKLELVRHLFNLNHLYEVVDNMTNIKKV